MNTPKIGFGEEALSRINGDLVSAQYSKGKWPHHAPDGNCNRHHKGASAEKEH